MSPTHKQSHTKIFVENLIIKKYNSIQFLLLDGVRGGGGEGGAGRMRRNETRKTF